jgi:S-adenosylmethionine synthetase
MSSRTFIFQLDGGGEEKTITIDVNKTVKDLIDIYLKGKNLSNSLNDFAFMVGANPLKSAKNINSQIKNVKFLRPNATIKVREVDTKAGGRL